MSSIKKKILLSSIAVLALSLCCLKCWNKLVDDFTPKRCQYSSIPDFVYKEFRNTLQPPEDALNTRYYFIGSGSQFYAFESTDGRYILKTFKNYRWQPNYFRTLLLSKERKRSYLKKLSDGVDSTYKSTLLCFKNLKDESAIVHLQLLPSPSLPQVIVYDRLHIPHKVDLSKTPFILQKKATPLPRHLLGLKDSGAFDESVVTIDALLDFIVKRRRLNLTDKDPNFVTNFGVVNGHIVSFDVGGTIYDPKKDNSYFYKKELSKVKKNFTPWLQTNYPQLAPVFLEKIESLRI